MIIVDDGAGGTNRKATMSRVATYTRTDISSAGAGEANKALIMNANSEIASGVSSFLATDLIGSTAISSRGTLGVSGSVTLGVAGSDPSATIRANAPFLHPLVWQFSAKKALTVSLVSLLMKQMMLLTAGKWLLWLRLQTSTSSWKWHSPNLGNCYW